MDGIIEFLAPENIRNDHTFYENPLFPENKILDFYWNEKIATFNTAKSRWYGGKPMAKTDSPPQKT